MREPAHVIGGIVKDLVGRVVGYLFRKPLENYLAVKVAAALVCNRKVGVKTFICDGDTDNISVSGRPPRSMGLETWIFGLKINRDFFDADGRRGEFLWRNPFRFYAPHWSLKVLFHSSSAR